MALCRVVGGLVEATAGTAFALGGTCTGASAGDRDRARPDVARLAGIVPLPFGVGVLPTTALAPARWLLLALLAFAEFPVRLPAVALPLAFAAAVAPCTPAFPFLPAGLTQPLTTLLVSLLLLPLVPPALVVLPLTPRLLPPALGPP
ncbi:hypothetical protein JH26_10715 [Microvirga sp. BSC39]|nr:hypothetical protein JH26_10715 [Microvirga sp. BSC39]